MSTESFDIARRLGQFVFTVNPTIGVAVKRLIAVCGIAACLVGTSASDARVPVKHRQHHAVHPAPRRHHRAKVAEAEYELPPIEEQSEQEIAQESAEAEQFWSSCGCESELLWWEEP